MKKQLINGAIWIFLGRLASVLMGFYFSSLIVRGVGTNNSGLFFLWSSLVGFAAIASQLGTRTQIVRLIASSLPESRFSVAKSISLLALLLNGGVLLTAILTGWCFCEILDVCKGFHLSNMQFLLIALWIVFSSLISLTADAFRGLGNYKIVSIMDGETSLFVVFLSSILVAWQYHFNGHVSLNFVVFSIVLSGFVLIFFALFVILQWNGRVGCFSTIRDILMYSWPLYIHFILLVFLSKFAFWFLGNVGQERELAFYGVSLVFSNAILFPLVVINALLPSFIVKLFEARELDQLQMMLTNAAGIASVPSVVVGVLMLLYAGDLFSFFYGSDFVSAVPILQVLIIGQIINVLAGSSGLVLSMTGYQLELLKISAISVVLTVLVSLVLIPTYGAFGAALATSLGTIIQNLLMVLAVWRKLGIKSFASMSHLKDFIFRIRAGNQGDE